MDVNVVAATVAKLQPPPPVPAAVAGEAFANLLQAASSNDSTDGSALETVSPPAPASTPAPAPPRSPAPQQSANTPSNSTNADSAQAASAAATSNDQEPAASTLQNSSSGTDDNSTTTTARTGADKDEATDGDKSDDNAKKDDSSAQDAASVLLALLAAAAKQPAATNGTASLPTGKTASSEATGTATKSANATAAAAAANAIAAAGTSANAAAAALLAGQGTSQSADGKVAGKLQLADFQAVSGDQELSALLNDGSNNALAGAVNGTDGQIAVKGTAAAASPQSLLADSLLAAANAIGENGLAGLQAGPEGSTAGAGQKPGDGQPMVTAADVQAPVANPIVDAQTGQLQVGGAAFVTTANTSVTGAQGAANSSTGTQAALPAPIEQVALHMAKAAVDDVNRFSIELEPAGLGRVEVKMEVGHDGHVLATIAADRPQTLDMLQRDAAGLQRALQDAGLNTDGQSLSFSLRQDSGQAGGNAGQSAGGGNQRSSDNTATVPAVASSTVNRADDSGLDIRV